MKNLFFRVSFNNPKYLFKKYTYNSNISSFIIIYNYLNPTKVDLFRFTYLLKCYYILFYSILRFSKFLLHPPLSFFFEIRAESIYNINTHSILNFNYFNKISLKRQHSRLRGKYPYIFRRFEYIWEKHYFNSKRDILIGGDEMFENFFELMFEQSFKLNVSEIFNKVSDIKRMYNRSRRFFTKKNTTKLNFFKKNLLPTYKVTFQDYIIYIKLDDVSEYKYLPWLKYFFKNINNTTFSVNDFSLVSKFYLFDTQVIKYKLRSKTRRLLGFLEFAKSRKRKFYYAYFLHKTFKYVYNDYWEFYFYRIVLNIFNNFNRQSGFNIKILTNYRYWPEIYDLILRIKSESKDIYVPEWIPDSKLNYIFTFIDYNELHLGIFYKLRKDVLLLIGSSFKISFYKLKTPTLDVFKEFWNIIAYNKNTFYRNLSEAHTVLFDNYFWFSKKLPYSYPWGIRSSIIDNIDLAVIYWTIAKVERPGAYIPLWNFYNRNLNKNGLSLNMKPKFIRPLDYVICPRICDSYNDHDELVRISIDGKSFFPSLDFNNLRLNYKSQRRIKKKLKKVKYKFSHIIPFKKKKRIFKKIIKDLFARSLNNNIYIYSQFFFNFERLSYQKNKFFQPNLLGWKNLEKFNELDYFETNYGNIDDNSTDLDFSKYFLKNFNSSNYNPIFFLNFKFKRQLMREKNRTDYILNAKYLQFYINGFISHWTSTKSLFILQSNLTQSDWDFTSTLSTLSLQIVHYFSKIHVKFFKKFPVSKFIEFFTLSMVKKDLTFFVQFFKYFVEEVFLKEHRKVFYSFEFMLKKFLYKIMNWTSTKGIKFEVSGKISVTGNAKKRRKIIKLGYYSLTNKKLKIDYLLNTIRTSTGVLGFRTFMTY